MSLSGRSPSPNLMQNTNLSHYFPSSEHILDVTHINHPGSFFVRPTDFACYRTTLENLGDRINDLEQVAVGKRVMYESRILRKYVRGNITEIKKENGVITFKIFALDYGCFDEDICQIYKPGTYDSAMCPSYIMHCKLYMCHPKEETFDEPAIQAMESYAGSQKADVTIVHRAPEKLTVELRTEKCPEDISTMLAFRGHTTLLGLSKLINRFGEPQLDEMIRYSFQTFMPGTKLLVRTYGGRSVKRFYCAEINDYKRYVGQMRPQYKDYCSSQPLVDIKTAIAEKLCCGIYMISINEYERGIVLKEINPDKAIVKLIDTGRRVEVPREYIKFTPCKTFSVPPAVAICCSSTSDQVWNNGLPKFLYPGFQFIIEIVEAGTMFNMPHKVKLHPAKHSVV